MIKEVFPKYPSTESIHKNADQFIGKQVVVTEKIDGTSFRFSVNLQENTITFGSRNQILDTVESKGDNAACSFYGGKPVAFIQKKFNDGDFLLGEICNESIINFYGEWAGNGVMNRIKYGEPDFYLYRITVVNPGGEPTMLSYDHMKSVAKFAGLRTCPLLWRGVFDIQQLNARLPLKSQLASERQEGIVVTVDPPEKNQFGEIIIAKFKNADFEESKPVRQPKPALDQNLAYLATEFAHTHVTENRIHNIISHGDFPVTYSMSDMGSLVKLVPQDIEKECKKEMDEVLAAGVPKKNLSTAITNHVAATWKKIISERLLNGK